MVWFSRAKGHYSTQSKWRQPAESPCEGCFPADTSPRLRKAARKFTPARPDIPDRAAFQALLTQPHHFPAESSITSSHPLPRQCKRTALSRAGGGGEGTGRALVVSAHAKSERHFASRVGSGARTRPAQKPPEPGGVAERRGRSSGPLGLLGSGSHGAPRGQPPAPPRRGSQEGPAPALGAADGLPRSPGRSRPSCQPARGPRRLSSGEGGSGGGRRARGNGLRAHAPRCPPPRPTDPRAPSPAGSANP